MTDKLIAEIEKSLCHLERNLEHEIAMQDSIVLGDGEEEDECRRQHEQEIRSLRQCIQTLHQCRDRMRWVPFAHCFTDVNGKPQEFCDAPEHADKRDLRVRTPLYTFPQPPQQEQQEQSE